ncbi:MAG TPA: beta-N-acetylglucosaminidase domain-containing protein, partial [Bdellovibrionales bacterium]|nr:beta-N-acetylglucosaminidase domain-containing protein [Bdellovibrionales bacterium]
WRELAGLRAKCRERGVAFGVGLSPFEIHDRWDSETKARLREKVKTLLELEIDGLGLFFDDMKGAPDLAEKQVDIVDFVQEAAGVPVLFCPTYYSDDPILDKVFGARPPGYLEKLGAGLRPEVRILWTGSKVIPQSISASELEAVASVLKRKPFVWDNFFANDGPKQCKFLKLKPLGGRDAAALASSSGWAFNLMNQPALSELVFAASAATLKAVSTPENSLTSAAMRLAGSRFAGFLSAHQNGLLARSLDQLEESARVTLLSGLDESRFSADVEAWVRGDYNVGSECLTD